MFLIYVHWSKTSNNMEQMEFFFFLLLPCFIIIYPISKEN